MDILDEIIDLGERRGMLSYDEINAAFPTEYNSPEEREDFMGLLRDMGIRIVDDPELGTYEEERIVDT